MTVSTKLAIRRRESESRERRERWSAGTQWFGFLITSGAILAALVAFLDAITRR